MRTNARILSVLTAAGLLVVGAACEYEPVGVYETPSEDDVFEPSAVRDVAQQAGGAIGEPFRARLAIELDFDGELVPNETITLNLEGTATEKLSGGEVRILLPTFAAMAEAGGDKRPSYPVGKEIPATVSWRLPIMDAGAMWKQSVEIPLPGKGYYQVVVGVAAETLDDKDSFVLDALELERWMLVQEGGGEVTLFLDPDALPEDVLPEEGPFRERQRPSSGHPAAADAVADSDDEITFHVVYHENNSRKNAKGTEITIRVHNQADEVTSEFTETVGSTGMVSTDCPDNYEYITASVFVPITSETASKHVVGGTEVYASDCGTTRQVIANSYQFIAWRNLNDVIPDIESHFRQYRSAIKWHMVWVDSGGTFYYTESDKITFDYRYAKNPWVAAHEFGHAFHNEALGGIASGSSCPRHTRSTGPSYRCAYAEGFADYAGDVGVGQTSNSEKGDYSDHPYDAAEIEGNVAALLNDLIDSNNEGDDDTTYPPYYVGRVFESCVADNSAGDDVSDFVWCLENRINETVHDASFPRGNDAPDRVREGAAEPSDWSASKIRSTWLQNVG